MKIVILITLGVVVAVSETYQVLEEFAKENKVFIGDLYTELVKEHSGNFLVCPLSVQLVFGLLNVGAKGNTAEQITAALHLPKDVRKSVETFCRLSETLQANQNYTLSSANKIYLANNLRIKKEFKRIAVQIFRSDVQNIDFGKAHQAVSEVNRWVEEKTHDKIKNLLSEDMVGPATIAVLINALYFQGKWVNQFEDVQRMPFYHNKGVTKTNMMTVTADFNYAESPELKAKFLELPYEGDEITMTIVLPYDIEGLSALENQISEVLVTPEYEIENVQASIPKFKIDTTTPFVPILQRLGITDAFSSEANFCAIGDCLIISDVVQKAFIEVDEKGTTAAAATAVIADRISGGGPLIFLANHPFIFYLKHKVNGVIFIGRYSSPEDSDGHLKYLKT